MRILAVFLLCITTSFAQSPREDAAGKIIHVTLLGTASGPPVRLNRYQVSTLVEANGERLLFDCGRGTTLRLAQAGIPLDGVTKVFLTHLHSDHIVGLPDLYLSPWAGREQRKQPLEVWGPEGTRAMMQHLEQAFAFDIHIRRDVDEHFSPEGIKQIAHDIREGVVYERSGVKVTAFLVDHGPVKPAFGYRVDYAGHSLAISGDTRPSDNLVKLSRGVDVLIHETLDADTWRKQATKLDPKAVEAIINHHTSPQQAGQIFAQIGRAHV